MSKVKSDFKVFVSDEILDFRSLEKKYSRSSPINSLVRTRSHNAIDVRPKKEMPVVNERQITDLEKLAKTLYTSSPTLSQKYRSPRQKSRSKTVDPRFRRSRSPLHKLRAGSQSTANLNNLSMPHSQAKQKSQSASYLSSSMNRDFKITSKYSKDSKETKGEPSAAVYESKKPQESSNKFTAFSNEKLSASDDEQMEGNKYKTDALYLFPSFCSSSDEKQKNCKLGALDDLKSPSPCLLEVAEDEIIEESESLNDLVNAELGDEFIEKISPYWDDPRLLEKHNVMKPVRPRRIRSCITVPVLTKEPPSSGVTICRNCLTTQWFSPEYKYDDRTEICNSAFISNEHEISKDNVEKRYERALYLVLGSVAGILVMSFIAWFLSQHISWDSWKFWSEKAASLPPSEHTIIFYVKYCSANILHLMDNVYNKVYEILMMPRTDILSRNSGTREPNQWWLPKL